MMKLFRILTFIYALFVSLSCLGQDSIINRIGPTYYSSNEKVKYFFIVDGVPIFKNKKILELIDTTMIDSIIFHKDKVFSCNKKLLYNSFIEIRTKDSLNPGLKRILHQTGNWIFKYPLADLFINDRKIKWFKGYEKLRKNPDLIGKIDLLDTTTTNIKCGHEMIKIELKKRSAHNKK